MRSLSMPKDLAAVAWLMAYGLPLTAFPQTIIYVNDDATGANNGTSWANAYRFLQDAHADAADNSGTSQVWVAAGTYRPDETTANPAGTGSRTATFQLINNVALYGGFVGTEGTLSKRILPIPPEHESILSGDLNGDDGPNFTNNTENSYHVTTANNVGATALLDGFTITGGNANGPMAAQNYGAGMYATSASPVIRNCVISNNYAGDLKDYAGRGGGLFCQYGFPDISSVLTLQECAFTGNASTRLGGGIYSTDVSLTVSGCSFNGNRAEEAAGAMFLRDPGAGITTSDCIFASNSAGFVGGAVVLTCVHQPVTVVNCVIAENTAAYAGGFLIDGVPSSEVVLSGCEFNANSAEFGLGGGVIGGCLGFASGKGWSCPGGGGGHPAKIVNCSFYGNVAEDLGGGVIGCQTLVNCLFSGNSAVQEGGGAYLLPGAPTTNCTFSQNSAANGGGVAVDGGSFVSMRNSVFYGNTAGSSPQIYGTQGMPTVTYSCVQGGFPGAGNTAADPIFVDPDGADNFVGTPDDDLRLSPSSPCIDAADNAWIAADVADLDNDGDTAEPTPFDADFGPRRSDRLGTPDTGAGSTPLVDMGAFEWTDCNLNGVDDGEDIVSGNSQDANGDGTPDECSFWASDLGVWDNPINWDPPEVPNNNPQSGRVFVPVIDDLNAQVTLDIDAEVNGLSVVDGASLGVTAGDLTIATSAGIVNGGVINVDGTHAIFGGTGPILVRSGGGGCPRGERGCSPPVLRLTALAHLETASVSVLTGSVELAGSATGAITGPVTLDGDGQLLLDESSSLAVDGDLALRATGGGGCPRGEPSDTTIRIGAELSGSSRHSDPGLRDNSAAPSGLEYIATGYQELTPLATHLRPFGAGPTDVPLTPHPSPLTPSPQRDAERGCSPPVLRIMAFSTMDMEGSLRLETSGDVVVEAGTTVMLAGDLDNRSTDPSIFDWASGPLTLDGTEPQSVEAAGEDRGATTNGLLDNFAIGTLTLAAGATVNVLDAFDNQQDGVAVCDEALYVDTLAVGNGATLNTAGCRVYYRTLTNNGSIPRLGIDVLKIGSGDWDGDGDVDLADYAAMVDCTTGPDAGPLPPGCDIFDFASDGDIDLADFGAIQTLVDPT